MKDKKVKLSKRQLINLFNIEKEYIKYETHYKYNVFNNLVYNKGLIRLVYTSEFNTYTLILIDDDYKLKHHTIETKEGLDYIKLTIRKNKLKKLMNGR